MNVYTLEIIVQGRQQNFQHEAEQSRLAHDAASEKRHGRNIIGEGLRQLLTHEPAHVEPAKRVTQVPARNRG